jgi:hypothetical protein
VQLPSLPLASLTPMPQFRLAEGDSELNSSLLAPQIGRFARRSNQDDAASTGSGGGQTNSNNATPSPESEKSDTDDPVSANLAPRIISDGGEARAIVSVVENSTAVTTVNAIDPDDAADIRFFIAGGADESAFTINSLTGELRFVTPPDFEARADLNGDNTYELTVLASAGSQIDTQHIRVRVIDQNEAPIITSDSGGPAASLTRDENQTAITIVTAADPDSGTTLQYSIVGGADASRFTINPLTGALSFVSGVDFEHPDDAGADNIYDVVVRASDGTLTDDQSISVTVAD